MSWSTSPSPSDNSPNRRVATASLADLDHVGVYALSAPTSLGDLVLVRRARRGHRYALRFGKVARYTSRNPAMDGGLHITFPQDHYLGAKILADIGPGDRVPDAKLLRMLAAAGPYDLCGICHRPTADTYWRNRDDELDYEILSMGTVTAPAAREAAWWAGNEPPRPASPAPETASTSDIQRMFGFGSSCIRRHLDLKPKVLQTMYRAQITAGLDRLFLWANEGQ